MNYSAFEDHLLGMIESGEVTAMQLINYITQFLTDDPYWLEKNISKVDKEILKAAINKISN